MIKRSMLLGGILACCLVFSASPQVKTSSPFIKIEVSGKINKLEWLPSGREVMINKCRIIDIETMEVKELPPEYITYSLYFSPFNSSLIILDEEKKGFNQETLKRSIVPG